jgi:hypothetical protein
MYQVVAYTNFKFLLHSFPGKNKHMRRESSWGRKSRFASYRFAFLCRAANTNLSSTIQCQNLWLTLRVNCYVGFIYVGNCILCQTVLISHFCKLIKTFWNNIFVEAHFTGCGRCLRLSQSSQICLGVSLKIRETNRALQSHRCFWKC